MLWGCISICVFSLWAAYAPRFCGKDYGVTEKDPVDEVDVFRQRRILRFVWSDVAEVLFHPGFEGTVGLTNVHFAILAGVAVCASIFEA